MSTPLVTTPYSDYRIGSRAAVLVKEVSGVSSGVAARDACQITVGSSTHPEDQTFTCQDYDAQCVAPNFWRVTFSFAPPGGGGGNMTGNLVQTPTMFWGVGVESVATDRDIDDNVICNSARDPIDPPPSSGVPYATLTVNRWEPAPFNVQRALSIIGKVNEKPFTIQGYAIAAGQCRCTGYQPAREYTMKDTVIEVSYNFELKGQGFDFRVLDQGYYGWRSAPGGNQPIPICTKGDASQGETPQLVNAPVRLNGKGAPINAAAYIGRLNNPLIDIGTPLGAKVETIGSGADAVTFLTYKVWKRTDFTTLGL